MNSKERGQFGSEACNQKETSGDLDIWDPWSRKTDKRLWFRAVRQLNENLVYVVSYLSWPL